MKKNEEKEIAVSVVVTTYNQKDTIIEALDSVTMQKTKFSFEIIVGIDNSPDNTYEILKKYKAENKNKNCEIILVNREKNLGPSRNEYELVMSARGKYVAFLEGDDFWCNDLKLQIQYNFLEKNQKYVAVAHDMYDVYEDGTIWMKHSDNGYKYKKVVKHSRAKKGYLDYHQNSLMTRNVFKDKDFHYDLIYKSNFIVQDLQLPLFLTDIAPIYIMREVMGCYRYCDNRYNQTYLEHTLESLDLLSKIHGKQLKNHKADYSCKIARSIATCYIFKFKKHEKNESHSYKELWQYIDFKIFIIFILEFITIPITQVGKILYKKLFRRTI